MSGQRTFSHRSATWRVGLVAVAMIAMATATATAQVNNAEIDAVVSDAEGGRLPGVTVEATAPATGLQRSTVTNNEGVARLVALPPGEYDVRFSLEGFAPAEQRLTVRVGQTAQLRVTLTLEATREEIVVTAESPLVDVYKIDSSTNIVPEQIDSLPVADRDFQKLAFIAPGVQRERGAFRFVTGGPVIGAAGNASQATIFVDGVDFTDPALGLARARFSQDAIQELRVIGNRFDAEIGGSAGGALSIITRSGTNDLSGRVFAFFRDDSLREPGALEQDDLPFSREQWGASLGGAIARDRTHYFLSFERIDEDNVSLFRPQGAFAGLAADVAHPFEQTLVFGSLSHQLGEGRSLSAKAVWEDYEEENFRVGGVADVSYGQTLLRDNTNLSLEHVMVTSSGHLNEARFQYGDRTFDEPLNNRDTAEWFSNGTTLQTGSNILGDLLGAGELFEVRDTFHVQRGAHDLKVGFSAQLVEERSRIDTFQEGLFVYATDDRSLPIVYLFGTGSSDVTADTERYGLFVNDDWQVNDRLTVSLGLRYDYDTNGNNPDFRHSLVPGGRDVDDDNFQPRLGFSWDAGGDGRHVVRGGAGLFTGRYLLIPTQIELQQNGEVGGRVTRRNLNGLLLGLPPAFWLDPLDPENSGIPLAPDISLMDTELVAPESVQLTLGYTTPLADTGLFFDVEGIYVEGDDEIVIRDTNFGGNANPVRPDPRYAQVNTYTNEGRSEYTALVLSLNGTLEGGHLVTVSATFSEKENIADDFSPAFPTGYPSDPADIEAEYGRSRSDEPFRLVASGIFRLPWGLTLAPILEYGDGQPWTRRLGYDFNGDGKNSDRAAGVARNGEDGPDFQQLSVRLTKSFELGDGALDVIVEAFNVTDETNYDVSSIDGAEFLAGPTLADPAAAFVANPNFGNFSTTFPGREIQLGLRWQF